MQGPLVGLKAIDVSTVIAGSVASSMLGDFGAEVIKVEHPAGGDPSRGLQPRKAGVSLWHKVAARNKKSITLNLSKPVGQQLLRRLVDSADVLIENFRAGTMEKWNLGYAELDKVNPRLVMVRISGYGQDGPYSHRAGFGTIAEAISGLPYRTGLPGGPPIFASIALADEVAGLFGAMSAMFAIYQRDHGTGTGQVIDIGLFEPLFRLIEDQVIAYDQLGLMFERLGNRMPQAAPRGVFLTKDEQWIVISAFSEPTAKRLLRTIGGPSLENDPRFVDNQARVQHVEELEAVIRDWIAQRTETEVLEIFERDDVVGCSLYNIEKIVNDPQYQHRKDILRVSDPDLGEVRVPGVIPKFARTPGAVEYLSVPLGHNNEEIYCGELGLKPEELETLHKEGVL